MALPTNKIKKVKLPNNTEYDIVPTMLQDGTTNNKLSVPTLTDDDEVVTTRTSQTISGSKTFSSSLQVSDTGELVVNTPASATASERDLSLYVNADQLELYDDDAGTSAYLTLPYKTGTVALTDDIQNVEIVDLTSVN